MINYSKLRSALHAIVRIVLVLLYILLSHGAMEYFQTSGLNKIRWETNILEELCFRYHSLQGTVGRRSNSKPYNFFSSALLSVLWIARKEQPKIRPFMNSGHGYTTDFHFSDKVADPRRPMFLPTTKGD